MNIIQLKIYSLLDDTLLLTNTTPKTAFYNDRKMLPKAFCNVQAYVAGFDVSVEHEGMITFKDRCERVFRNVRRLLRKIFS